MIQNGLTKAPTDHRDYDLHKTFGSTSYDTKGLPNTFDVDAGLTMPDQNAEGLPMGCTGYSQADLCNNEDATIYDPADIYLNTPPGGRILGREIRKSMAVLLSRGPRTVTGGQGPKRTAFFNVRATGFLDWYDAIRVAMWVTQDEKRAVSVALPWFPEFEGIITNPDGSTSLQSMESGILPIPAKLSWSNASGHNAVISGWTDKNTKGELIRGGEVFLRVKSWQGRTYGDQGWCYMSRALVNALLNMPYTEAMTVTKLPAGSVQRVDLNMVERLVSFMTNLVALADKLIAQYAPEGPVVAQDAPKPQEPTPAAPEPHKSRIREWAKAIEAQEGGRPQDINMRLNNPGNLKFTAYTKSLGGKKSSIPGLDGGTFCEFDTYEQGFAALCTFLTDAANDQLKPFHDKRSLMAFTMAYANIPSTHPYLRNIRKALNVSVLTPISELL